jgi:hypothetical protein
MERAPALGSYFRAATGRRWAECRHMNANHRQTHPFDPKAKLSLPVPHRKTYTLFNQPPVKPARLNPRTRLGTLRVAFQMIPVL